MFYYYFTSLAIIGISLVYYLFPQATLATAHLFNFSSLPTHLAALAVIITTLGGGFIGLVWFKKWRLVCCLIVVLFFSFQLTHHQYQQQTRLAKIEKVTFSTNQTITSKVVKINGFKKTRFETLIEITPHPATPTNATPSLHFNALLYTRVKLTNLAGDFIAFTPDYITRVSPPSSQPPSHFALPEGYRKYLISQNIFVLFTTYKNKVTTTNKINPTTEPNKNLSHLENIYHSIHAALTTKTWSYMQDKINRWVSPPANGLAYSLLTGDKSNLSNNFKENFRRTGTYHVLAVSGMHAVLLTLFFFSCFRLLGFRKPTAILPVMFIVLPLYLVITSGQISIFRTYLMALVAFFLHRLDRKVNLLAILNLVFIAIVCYSPTLVYNISLQLSFSAVLGIGLMIELLKLPPLQAVKSNFIKGLLVSVGAQLGTLSFVIYYFGYANFLALFYNIVISVLIAIFYLYTLLFVLLPLDFLPGNISNLFLSSFGEWLSLIGKTIDAFLSWSRLDLEAYEFTQAQNHLPLAIGLFLGCFFLALLAIRLLKRRGVKGYYDKLNTLFENNLFTKK